MPGEGEYGERLCVQRQWLRKWSILSFWTRRGMPEKSTAEEGWWGDGEERVVFGFVRGKRELRW